jgi:hypothetical protein
MSERQQPTKHCSAHVPKGTFASGAISFAPSAAAALCAALLLFGCAAYRPVLYPNQHLNTVGYAVAERDIEDCKSLASSYRSSGRAGRIARDTAIGGGTGAAVGAAAGAAVGNAGRGAAAGAAGGATARFLQSILHPRGPSAVHKSYVNTCLADRGYRVIGWE